MAYMEKQPRRSLDDNVDNQYLYGDLELEIIRISWGENDITSCLGDLCKEILQKVDIAICLYKNDSACSKISRNLDGSTGKHKFQVSVAHCIRSKLEVRMRMHKKRGVAIVPCTSIDGRNNFKDCFPVSGRDFLMKVKRLMPIPDKKNNKHPIQLELQVKFTPCNENSLYKDGIGAEYELTESYFPLRTGGKVTLYQDAHCMADPTSITIPLENDSMFNRGACWEDICHAILNAKQVVYIVGWDISHKVRLRREPEESLETLGELLKNKSRQGVKVLVLAWNEYVDFCGIYEAGGFMKTEAKETESYFENKEGVAHYVKCELAHRNLNDESNYIREKFNNLVLSHHQKCVIVDENGKITAFIGGLDLCSGRYDTPEHRLYGDHDTVFQDDFFNATFQTRKTKYPREPWHDLHCKIEGEAAIDVLTNFKQRWQEATKKKIEDVPEVDYPHVDRETWNVQIFRSIDSGSVQEFSPKIFDEYFKMTFDGIKKGSIQEFPSMTVEAIKKGALIRQENVVIDRSIQMAYIQAIRSAHHFIYIENQYFHGSLPDQNIGGDNLIPMELALKLASKIREKEEFRVYVVIPMWPEGDPKSEKFKQYMLDWQRQTMEMMYKIIAEEIKSVGLRDAHPTDYLNFYCLGKRESPPQDTVNEESLPSHKHGRFMIYVHSKGMIVDDAYVILGSANINHRSMDGSRDTEIAMGAYQPQYICTEENKYPRGQVYGYRMSLWLEHLGEEHPVLREPESLKCVEHINRVAKENWDKYSAEQFTELQGHILKYPVKVDVDGKVTAMDGHGTFPDVGGQVLGNTPPTPLMSVGLTKQAIGTIYT